MGWAWTVSIPENMASFSFQQDLLLKFSAGDKDTGKKTVARRVGKNKRPRFLAACGTKKFARCPATSWWE
jgi:hypothetical protein